MKMYGQNYYQNQPYQAPYYQIPMPVPDTLAQLRQQQSAPVQQPQQQPQVQNGIIWVQGESGAKSYLLPPNTTALLMDSENSAFYIKSVDASGVPLPLRAFDFVERQQNSPNACENAPKNDFGVDFGKFVTRDELDEILAKMSVTDGSNKKTAKQVKDGADNG